jgi:hypothetical protein
VAFVTGITIEERSSLVETVILKTTMAVIDRIMPNKKSALTVAFILNANDCFIYSSVKLGYV